MMRMFCLCFAVVTVIGIVSSCATNVPLEKVYGKYVATYPYGTEMIILNPDGTFIQRAAISRKNTATARGRWDFDQSESRVTLYGAMIIDNGFGQLRPEWNVPSSGLVSDSAEIHWSRVVMGSGLLHPYVKQ